MTSSSSYYYESNRGTGLYSSKETSVFFNYSITSIHITMKAIAVQGYILLKKQVSFLTTVLLQHRLL